MSIEIAAEPDEPADPGRVPPSVDSGALPARIARRNLAWALDHQAHLCFARRALIQIGASVTEIDKLLLRAMGYVDRFTALSGGHIEGRHRPVQQRWTKLDPPCNQYFLCLDECGSHQIRPTGDPFPAFGISGVIVDDERYLHLDRTWKGWKARALGDPNAIVHEPDVRTRSGRFHRHDTDDARELMSGLEQQLTAIEFTLITAVIHKTAFFEAYGAHTVDAFLPASPYLMCLDFVIERFVHFLNFEGGDARGIVIAESRGPLEDAQVQQEYVRLMIEGTQYHSASWFRYQLAPFVEFLPKGANHSGLQIADLAARPCVEKVLHPESVPDRWAAFAAKLYDGGKGKPNSYGLKVFPTILTDQIVADNAEGDACAPPSTD